MMTATTYTPAVLRSAIDTYTRHVNGPDNTGRGGLMKNAADCCELLAPLVRPCEGPHAFEAYGPCGTYCVHCGRSA